MEANYTYRPVKYFFLTYIFTWIPWLIAAYCSYQDGMNTYVQAFFFLGGAGPSVMTLVLIWISKNRALKSDFLDRLVNLGRARWAYLLFSLLLCPFFFLLSARVSVFFGGPANQLAMPTNWIAQLPLIFLAPIGEEIGWRGYGMDSLRSRLGMLNATLLFALLWALWHAPLLFINHTYQHDLWLMGPLYVTNFFVSVIPIAVIANWLYYKNDRLILSVMLLHFGVDAVAMSFNIEQSTKCFVTVELLVVALAIALFDRNMFKQGPKNFLTVEVGAN